MTAPRYHPRYCEENVWHLCREALADAALVVFVTNPTRRVCMWQQRAAPPGEPIVWDYHVIAAERGVEPRIWDLDCRLGWPLEPGPYLAATFATVGVQPPVYDPRFRIVAAEAFVREFRSDRSHMRRANGTWHAPPPPWPAVSDPQEPSNLSRYLDLEDPAPGAVCDLAGLRRLLVP